MEADVGTDEIEAERARQIQILLISVPAADALTQVPAPVRPARVAVPAPAAAQTAIENLLEACNVNPTCTDTTTCKVEIARMLATFRLGQRK